MKLYREHKAARKQKTKTVKDMQLLPPDSQESPVIIYEESGFLTYCKKVISCILFAALMLVIAAGISLLLISLLNFAK